MLFLPALITHPYFPADDGNLGGGGLFDDSRFLDEIAEVPRRSVHVRDLFVDLDQNVRDAVHGKDCHQVFNSTHPPSPVIQCG